MQRNTQAKFNKKKSKQQTKGNTLKSKNKLAQLIVNIRKKCSRIKQTEQKQKVDSKMKKNWRDGKIKGCAKSFNHKVSSGVRRKQEQVKTVKNIKVLEI